MSTKYTYDILNHLTGVSMPRGANTQTRTFNYLTGTTVGMDLLSSTNPENGTVGYTYNSDHTVHTKTDNKGQVFTYSYDSYRRLTQITLGASTVLRTFTYDTAISGFSGSYTQGRLVSVQHTAFTPQGYLPGVGGSNVTVPSSMNFVEMYDYSQAGQTIKKRLQVNETMHYYTTGNVLHDDPKTLNLDGTYTYDNEGKMTSVNYPTTWSYNGTNLVSANGPTYTYSFDAMRRPTGLTDQSSNTLVNNVTYNAANQLLTFNTETRTYNNLNQMTHLQVGTSLDINYNFPAGTNNGKISTQTDNLSGETVTYAYDSLNRLLSATTATWSETCGFDGFGNLLSKTPTGGAPTLSQAVDTATNHIVGQSYDGNGNQTSSPLGTLVYDAENRIASMSAAAVQYKYDSANKRIWKSILSAGNLSQEVYFYGVDGQKIGTYTIQLALYSGTTNPQMTDNTGIKLSTFFGSKRLGTYDRLGSAKFNPNGQQQSFYPYGEDRGTVQPNDSLKFATYTRDTATGLDYADQRYYANNFGRFMSPDPYSASVGAADPKSWNRYSYTRSDPVNRLDRAGLQDHGADEIIRPQAACVIPWDNPPALETGPCSPPQAPGGGGGGSDPAAVHLAQAQDRLKQIASSFKPTGKCLDFLKDLLSNGGSGKVDINTFIDQIKSMAADSANDLFSGLSADNVQLTDAAFPGANSNGAKNVTQWFKQQGDAAIALSQFNSPNIYLDLSKGFGAQYGLGIMLHELLHKQGVDGGFSHNYLTWALDEAGAPARVLGQGDDIGSRIGEICFQ